MLKGKIYWKICFVAMFAVFAFLFGFSSVPATLSIESAAKADPAPNTYTIQFDTSDWEGINEITAYEGGASVVKTATDSIEYSYVDGDPSERVYLYNLNIDGYDFKGWYISSLETARFDRDVGFYYIDSYLKSNLLLYADFEAIPYHISYMDLEGATNKNPDKYTTDVGLVFKKAERTGYDFKGWYKDAAKTLLIEEIEAGTIGDVVVYAKFEIKDCTLSFAYGDYDDIVLKYGEKVTAEMLPTPERKGFMFDGWYTSTGFYDEVKPDYVVSGDITLYPKWKKIENPIWKPLTFGGMGLCLVLTLVWFLIFRKNSKM